MTEPVYDYPYKKSSHLPTPRGSPTLVSNTDRLLLTQNVWLHLTVNSATALHILQREPPGTFLVRKSKTRQQMVLYMRLSDDCVPSFIHQTCIHEGPAGIFLDQSTLTFPDLIRLVSHYIMEKDVLPYTLRLPAAIEKVTSRKQLEAISHLGLDCILEKSLHRLVLKPLRSHLVSEVTKGMEQSGELERLGKNMQAVRKGGSSLLGVTLTAPVTQEQEKIRHKLLRMEEKYSPCDKVRLLLQACRGVYRNLDSQQDDACGADEFLPALCYVLALCDLPQLLVHTHYTVELLPQDTLMGEGGYYLTSVSAALSVLSSLHTHPQDGGLSLTEWHRRRQGLPSLNDLQNFLRVAHQDPVNGCTTKTILLRPTQTVADLCNLCALKFKPTIPEEYAIFLHCGGDQQLLPPETRPQEIKAQLKEAGASFYFCYQRLEEGLLPERGVTQDLTSEH